jgi:hypothetical protein
VPRRLSPRIVPPWPITVAIEEDCGPVLAYGIIADISGSGARVWTYVHVAVGAALQFRISFAAPPEVHEVVGAVVWAHDCRDRSSKNISQCGVEWLSSGYCCRARLRELASRAVPPRQKELFPFEKPWTIKNDWPPS